MHCCFDFSCLTNCEMTQLSFSVFLTFVSIFASILLTLLTYFIIYSLKPNLKIICACAIKNDDKIKITVENVGRFNAVNVRAEACAYDETPKYTYHLEIDHNEFLIIPGNKRGKDNIKKFKIVNIAESAYDYIEVDYIDNEPRAATKFRKYLKLLELIENGTYKLRFRVHSYHEFSGLGKAEEKQFTL